MSSGGIFPSDSVVDASTFGVSSLVGGVESVWSFFFISIFSFESVFSECGKLLRPGSVGC